MTDMIYSDVFDALADTPIEAENLKTWADLMASIQAIIQAIIQTKGSWKQAEAANQCGLTQPRINDLLRGRISKFSIDALVNIASALGQRVCFELKAA